MAEITDAVPHNLRNLLIGAMLDCIDENMLAEHYADVERMADDAIRAIAPTLAAQERERCAQVVEESIYIMAGSGPSRLEHSPKRAKNDAHHATIAAAIRQEPGHE